jgi:hypothetical protein
MCPIVDVNVCESVENRERDIERERKRVIHEEKMGW